MSDVFLIVRIPEEKKKALKDRAFDLRLEGGMSGLVLTLIDKELAAAASASPTPEPPQ
jgi:hypothetical protein